MLYVKRVYISVRTLVSVRIFLERKLIKVNKGQLCLLATTLCLSQQVIERLHSSTNFLFFYYISIPISMYFIYLMN